MLHWVSNPADMEAAFPKDSPEREVVRNIPSVWEETIVLPPSAIGECAAFARRSGNQWYIALMNGDGRERTVSIPLNFLDKNTAYQASILRDLAEKNDGWSVETRKVTSGNTLSFTMRIKGGGTLRNAASCPLKNGILPQAGKKPPLFFPLQRRSGGKPCSSAATPPVLEKPGKK